MNMEPFASLQQRVRERFINSEAERTAQEVSSLLDEMVSAVGQERMNEVLRDYGYNVEPDMRMVQHRILFKI